jgi:hypothetical protein
LFEQFFKSVYVGRGEGDHIPNVLYSESVSVNDCVIESSYVKDELDKINTKKPAGPDGIPNVFLRQCSSSISYPLYVLFRESLKKGCFPERWKESYIIPVFKKGDKSDVKNYRPICILSAMPKFFESVVLHYITPQMGRLINQAQHGFVKGRSTLTNLMIYEDHLMRAFAEKSQVDTVYTDFSKAFDRVPHDVLLHKLRMLGVGGSLHEWIAGYLSERRLVVRLDATKSNGFIATSGVPQGSHLGPLLFLLFVNDICSVFEDVIYLLFADDLKIFKQVNTIFDCQVLQDNLENLGSWCEHNRLFLNIGKCQIITFTRKKNPLMFDYRLGNDVLERVDTIRDLGIIFDQRLSFVPHIEDLTSRGMRMLGFVLRTTRDFVSIPAIKTLFVSLVRSRIEYNSPIWSPYYTVHSNNIERIQRKFLRYVGYLLHIPVEEIDYSYLLSLLNMSTLSDRRIISDLGLLFRIVRGQLDCFDLTRMISYHVPTRTTRQVETFHTDIMDTNYLYNSPINRLHRLGNIHGHLSDIFVDTLCTFRRRISESFKANM